MRVLIAGGNGQLGRDLQAVLAATVTATALDLPALDITDAASVGRAFASHRPEVVINAAAYTQVDQAEREPDAAFRVNALGPALLAEACRRGGVRLIHVSTDFVFDGRRPAPHSYRESDPTAPLGAYGRGKFEGEQAVQASGADAAIFRTAWLYGRHGNNFLRTMLSRAIREPARVLRVVNDQHGSPTWSRRLAFQLADWAAKFETGLYHAAGEGGTTRYDLARRFLERIGVPHTLEPCAAAQFPSPAPRPMNSMLENAALHAAGRCVMMPWERDLDAFADHVREAWVRELSA